MAPLCDAGAKVLSGVDYPHECRANSLDDDGVGGRFGIHVGADAVVDLAIEDRGMDVRVQSGDQPATRWLMWDPLPAAWNSVAKTIRKSAWTLIAEMPMAAPRQVSA